WCYDPDQRRFVRIGGRMPTHSNEIWSCDLGTMTWKLILPHALDPATPGRGLMNRPGYGSYRGICYDRDNHCVWDYGGGGTGIDRAPAGIWKGIGDLGVSGWSHIKEVPATGHSRIAYDEHVKKVVCIGMDSGSWGHTYVYDPVSGQMTEAAA